MNNKLVIAIDYGTQSVRVSIINTEGKFLGFEQEKYDEPYFSKRPGYAEQDADYYYNTMCKCAKRLTSKYKDLLSKCISISSTCFRDSVAFLDNQFKQVRPAIIWLDQRQAKLERKIPKIDSVIFDLVGMHEAIKLNRKRTPALWVQENEPEVWKKVRYYAPINCYLNYRLLGKLGDCSSNMVGHFPINFKTGKLYKKNAMKGLIFGVEPEQIPTIFEIGEVAGTITKECSLETGFPEGLNYITTGADKTCEVLGCGSIDNKCAHISYGTASCVDVVTKRYINPEPFLPSYKACYKGLYNAEVQIYRGYWMLGWFSKQFGEKESTEAKIEHMAVEEILNKKLMDIPPGSDGLVLQPYWGPGLHRPLAKGSVIGFYDAHTKFHIYRAIIEGIAYGLKEGLLGIEKKTHVKVTSLTIAGGGSKSDAICQITSDIFNLPIYKSETYESSSLGCAMSQFISQGIFKNDNEAKSNMVRYLKTFVPNKDAAKEYKYLFNNVYSKIYPKLKNIYKTLSYHKENKERK
ncbi:MAG: FGGY-family carbohydrate kinase [Bacilli bacterium]